MTAPSATPAQAARAQAAHTAAQTAEGQTPAQQRAQFLAQAQNVLNTAQTLSSLQGASALTQGAVILTGAANALTLAAGVNPELAQAAQIVSQVSTGAQAVAAAVQGGLSLPLALAHTAVGFVPDGPARTLASSLVSALAFAGDSDAPALTAAQGILGSLTQYAVSFAAAHPGTIPPVALNVAQNFVLPFLADLAGGGQGGPQKYTPGSLLQVGLDLLHLANQPAQETP